MKVRYNRLGAVFRVQLTNRKSQIFKNLDLYKYQLVKHYEQFSYVLLVLLVVM